MKPFDGPKPAYMVVLRGDERRDKATQNSRFGGLLHPHLIPSMMQRWTFPGVHQVSTSTR